jgi:hypothetical protein
MSLAPGVNIPEIISGDTRHIKSVFRISPEGVNVLVKASDEKGILARVKRRVGTVVFRLRWLTKQHMQAGRLGDSPLVAIELRVNVIREFILPDYMHSRLGIDDNRWISGGP